MFNKFCSISHQILQSALEGVPKIDFLKKILGILLDFTGCDSLELRIKQDKSFYQCVIKTAPDMNYSFETLNCLYSEKEHFIPCCYDERGLEIICSHVSSKTIDLKPPHFTSKGSFFTGDSEECIRIRTVQKGKENEQDIKIGGDYASLAFLPFFISGRNNGILILKSLKKNFFSIKDIYLYESLCTILGDALIHQKAQATLRERVKEITCLYEIAQAVKRPGLSFVDIFQKIVELLPPAWQYPDFAQARIVIDDKEYTTKNFVDVPDKISSRILLRDEERGNIEVGYSRKPPDMEGDPFLPEEQNLLDTVAQQIALIIERKQAEEERLRLQDQLRHADRLATIGQLSAGVAHEINEPLSNILGFSQLSMKTEGLPPQVRSDLNCIINASLHAREIIKKLMLFGRQMPPQKLKVNLNKLIREGLFFLESRAAKSGIELSWSLRRDIPLIDADPSQIHQVLVNLVVNAIQAMPNGGKLTIETKIKDAGVELRVRDTGIGMSEDIIRQIFLPFFTTKDINEGTGLGLAVVHGIVKSHNGTIKVESRPGNGSVFSVLLPVEEKEKDKGTAQNGD